jgi:hypothetical protein
MKEADTMPEPEDKSRKRMEWFFFLVGYAISRWAHVDRTLFDFCRFALGTNEEKTAIVFYRSQSIGDHLALTDALMLAAQLQDHHLAQWKRIRGKIDKLLPFRNDIAHNPPVQKLSMQAFVSRDPSVPGRMENVGECWAIETESKKLLQTKSTREISATDAELVEHIRSVDDLQKDMYDLRWNVSGSTGRQRHWAV